MTFARDHSGGNLRWRFGPAPWLALGAVVLAACGTSSGPAPVIDRSYGERPAPLADEAGIHIVQRGETVYGIAQQRNIPTRALIERNNLRPPYRIAAGTRLQLPSPQIHKVRDGDTLYAISRQYGVDMASLARANRLAPPYTIQVGQRLNLPFGTKPKAAPVTQVARAQPKRKPPSPAAAASSTASSSAPPPSASSPAPPPSAAPSPTPAPQVSGGPRPRPKPAFRPAPAVPQRDAGGFVWPVEGRVLSSFGTKGSGLHNDGLNIAAPMGAPVRAVDNGVVAYAGSQIRGFGNMLLIKHADGLITAYAHTDKLLVARGDVVSRGQVIARVGKSGDIDAPQLHFEVRRGSQAVDPRKFLPS